MATMQVFLIAALSADGYIAQTASQVSTKWTSKEDAEFFTKRTKEAGVVVMGSKTFDTINRPLPGRVTLVCTRNAEQYSQWGDQVRATTLQPRELIAKLEAESWAEVAICGGTSIYTQFMQAGLINRMYLTIEPIIFGTGLRLFSSELSNKISLETTHQLSSQTMVLEYAVTNSS